MSTDADRFESEWLGRDLFKVVHVTYRVGYHDKTNVPGALALARKRGLLERNLDLEHASYFVSRMTITPTDDAGMGRRRKHLFVMMARNASSPIVALRAAQRPDGDDGLGGHSLRAVCDRLLTCAAR